jgi:hypothetical protein
MSTNQCAHTIDTYKLVSIPPEKKKEAQPRREKKHGKKNRDKKILQKIRKLKAAKQNLKQGRNKRGGGGSSSVLQ